MGGLVAYGWGAALCPWGGDLMNSKGCDGFTDRDFRILAFDRSDCRQKTEESKDSNKGTEHYLS